MSADNKNSPADRHTRDMENHLRRIESLAQVGFWEFDLDSGEVIASEQAREIYGLARKKVTIAEVQQQVLPEHRPRLDQALKDLIEKKAPYRVEFDIRRPADGAIRHIHSVAEYDAEQHRVLGTLQDATERQQILDKYRHEHQMLTRAERIAHIGSWEWEAESDTVYWSEEMFRIFGLPVSDTAPSFAEHQSLYLPDDREKLLTAVDKCMRQAIPYKLELRIERPDGQHRVCTVSGVPRVNSKGTVIGLAGSVHDITGRFQAREELAASEAYQRALVQSTADGFWVLDAQGRFLDVNSAYCRLSGYTRDELLQMHVSDIDVDEEPEDTTRHIEKIINEGSDTFEAWHRRKDGSVWPVEVSATWFDTDGGQFICYGRDLTQRKEREGALRESEERLQMAIEGAHIGLWDWNITENSVRYSDTWAALIGCKPEEMEPTPEAFLNRIHPDDRAMVEARLRKHLNGEAEMYESEHRMLHASGDSVWTLDRGRVVERDAEGNPLRATGLISDINELKKAETTVNAFFEQPNNLHMIADLNGVIQRVNSAWKSILGYDSEELLGKRFVELVLPEDREETLQQMDALSGNRPVRGFENRYRRKDGEYRTILWSANAPAGTNRVYAIGIDIAERKRAEEALASSNALFRRAEVLSHSGTWIFDIRTKISTVSENWQRLVGLESQDIVWEDFQQLIPEEEKSRVEKALRGVLEEGKPYEIQHDILRYDTRTRMTIQSFGEIAYDDAGAPIAIRGVSHDITERVRVEQAIRENEDRFQRMLAVVPDMVSIHDCDMNIIYSNWQGFANIPKEKRHSGTKCYQIYRGFDDICPDCRARSVLETGKPLQEEKLLPDGTWVDLRVIPMLDANGEVEMFMEWVRDITASKQQELNLRQTQFTVDAAPLSVFWINREGRFLYVNDTACKTLGYTRDELLQMGVDDIDPEHPARIRQERWELYRREGGAVFESVHQRKDGTTFPIQVHSRYLQYEGQEMEVAEVEDITERKNLQEQLTQSQKMESVGRLAGGIAHDFNNMLNVILGHAEMLQEDLPIDSPLRDDLLQIQKSAERSADLTRQLLAFARKQTVAPKVLDLNETVSSMLRMLTRLIGEDIDLLWKPGNNIGKVLLDPAQMDQLLANLCVNARDAIGNQHGKVTIQTKAVAFDEEYCATHVDFKPGDYVMLAVSDDGCGMDAETREHIFEPFYTTKGVGEGTGLGLATVYGIINQNNAFINVYSEPGHGTSFHIYLPVHRTGVQAVRQKQDQGPVARGTETVLLVEDEPAILRMTARILERQGYEVLTADTPGAALALARTHPQAIDLLITDVIMPEMNGRDLAKEVLKIHPAMHRLFMSGYTADVIAHQGVLEADMHFIQKPFSQQALAEKVRHVLDRHS